MGFSGSWSGNITSKQTKSVTIKFEPTEEKAYNGNITVYSNAASGKNTIYINGSGFKPAAKIALSGNLNFETTELEKSITDNLIITNNGNSDLKVDSIICPFGF